MTEAASTGIILALIGVISAFIALFTKMWTSHSDLTRQVLDVVNKNTEATQRQISSTEKLSRAVDKNTEVTVQQKDVLTKLAFDALNLNKRIDDNEPT